MLVVSYGYDVSMKALALLDPDTLELAMETLVQLQSSGRLIGMISHVPELKSRIPAHLEVIRGDDGSTAKFVIN